MHWYKQYFTVCIFLTFSQSHLLHHFGLNMRHQPMHPSTLDHTPSLCEASANISDHFQLSLIILIIFDHFIWFLTFYHCNLISTSFYSIWPIWSVPMHMHTLSIISDHIYWYSDYFTYFNIPTMWSPLHVLCSLLAFFGFCLTILQLFAREPLQDRSTTPCTLFRFLLVCIVSLWFSDHRDTTDASVHVWL
jgi:hypothetical protein